MNVIDHKIEKQLFYLVSMQIRFQLAKSSNVLPCLSTHTLWELDINRIEFNILLVIHLCFVYFV